MIPRRRIVTEPREPLTNALELIQGYGSDEDDARIEDVLRTDGPKYISYKSLVFTSLFVMFLATSITAYNIDSIVKQRPVFNLKLGKKECNDMIKLIASRIHQESPNILSELDSSSLNGFELSRGSAMLTSDSTGDLSIRIPGNEAAISTIPSSEIPEFLTGDLADISLRLKDDLQAACNNEIYIKWGEHTLTIEQMIVLIASDEELSEDFVKNILHIWEYYVGIENVMVGLMEIDYTTLFEKINGSIANIPTTCNRIYLELLDQLSTQYHITFSKSLHSLIAYIFSDIRITFFVFLIVSIFGPIFGKWFVEWILKTIYNIIVYRILGFERQLTPEEREREEVRRGLAEMNEILDNIRQNQNPMRQIGRGGKKGKKIGGGKYILNDSKIEKLISGLSSLFCESDLKTLQKEVKYFETHEYQSHFDRIIRGISGGKYKKKYKIQTKKNYKKIKKQIKRRKSKRRIYKN